MRIVIPPILEFCDRMHHDWITKFQYGGNDNTHFSIRGGRDACTSTGGGRVVEPQQLPSMYGFRFLRLMVGKSSISTALPRLASIAAW